MRIALSADHTGYEQLQELKPFLEGLGHECRDFGPAKLETDDDYPDFIRPAAHAVAAGECEKGIIIGGSAQGEAIAANKVKGIRCAVFYGPAVPRKLVDASGRASHDPYEIIKLSRLHNDANMLSLAARFLTMEDMKNAAVLWLGTDFSADERHVRRIAKLDKD